MLNPYTLLRPDILSALLKQPMYFVRQEYNRGLFYYDRDDIISVLLTHYPMHEVEKERAERHMRLLKKDSRRFLYNSSDPGHIEKLKAASLQPDGYRIYINLMQTNWKASSSMKQIINAYIRKKLPWWNYSPAGELKVILKERYGELFIALLWKGRQTEVLLDEIENLSPCAMI